MTNYGFEQALERAGIGFLRANVGDRYVHKALLEHGGVIVAMPALEPRSYALLDIYNLGYVEAVRGQGSGGRMPIADRVRVRHWLQEFDRRLTPARRLLGFAPDAEPATRPDAEPVGSRA